MKPPKYFYFRIKTDSKATKIILEDASDCDVVEVVRCRDCENWDTSFEQSYAGEKGHCQTFDRISAQDFYCGCGKRKDGGNDE